ncbi:hypothetical protein HBI81_047300 [Parastagonospora nodorum]|nr:hypothetical protein HBI09_225390 [Parastagonospora nodorum]KAH4178378.1 hypothetical protein HBH43_023310 [Parastagonospora nodorum]KAH4254090.1 hypothetical protein HBI03_191140 [Parastagonospora nodorum]KAH4265599.1 hypothetical protein HBI04_179900 [Parastagonospora nodorum]KAH4418125.1 hypothetical protein HBH92_055370 [Parastagonospora nodorum]
MYKTTELSELEYKLHIFLFYRTEYFQVISMLSVSRLAYLVSALAATARSSIIVMNCNQGTQSQDVDNAIKDVAEVARVAAAALVSGKINGKDDVFAAAYDPLMYPLDRPGLALTLNAVATLGSSTTLNVQIYCRENHIRYHKDDPKSYWEDRDYYSRANGKMMPIGVARNSKDKPGVKGSYTTLGYKANDAYDTSGMAHIFLHPRRLSPPAGTDRDLRRYPDIVKDGLDGKHNKIEDIKPLAQTLLHELIHAVGGLGPPDPVNKKRDMAIHDGPSGSPKVYGWAACNARRTRNEKNNDIADCITFLAQAIYLQIQGKDTFWTTGEIDPKTLRPKQNP